DGADGAGGVPPTMRYLTGGLVYMFPKSHARGLSGVDTLALYLAFIAIRCYLTWRNTEKIRIEKKAPLFPHKSQETPCVLGRTLCRQSNPSPKRFVPSM